jgi:molybdopterin/thiamine biosynthesis adenylyltransferase
VGAGGLASTACLYLAGAGIGRIGIVDFDVVELNNLHRQIIHSERNVSIPKVISARDAVLRY